jgi:hypothetical protein
MSNNQHFGLSCDPVLLPRIYTRSSKHSHKKNGSDQARFLTSAGVSNRNSLPCRAPAICASSCDLCISSVPISALALQSRNRSSAANISLRKFAAISFCFKTKFSSPSLLQSHRYPNGTSGLSVIYPPRDQARGFYSLVSGLSINSSPYVVLRREQERTNKCGTEKGLPVSEYRNNFGPTKAWSERFSFPPIAATGISRGSSFTTFRWASSTKSAASESPIRSHAVTGEVRHE